MDRLEQAGAGAPGPQAAQFVLERGVSALHAALEVGEIEFRQGRHRWEPIFQGTVAPCDRFDARRSARGVSDSTGRAR